MTPLKGQPIQDVSWLQTLEVVEVLCYYDGPLVSLVRDRKGETYVKVWCDCENTQDRHFIIKATPTEINKYGDEHAKALHELLTDPPCHAVIFIDEVWVKGAATMTAQTVNMQDFPKNYMPTP